MNIDEAILAFQDLKARYFVPTQWGTFQLGDNPPGQSALELKRKIKDNNLPEDRFLILNLGQIIELKK